MACLNCDKQPCTACRDLSTALAGLQGQGPLVSLSLEVVNDRAASGASASTSGREESIDGPGQGARRSCLLAEGQQEFGPRARIG